ncbi:DNA-binding protein [Bacteroides sp. ET71]|uniref:HU family DNA-binding protein n=1 Tax=Bacteroides sp. ET71 TaxID=2939421 RepID=UPI002013337B|nr:DNA-binding protein [Bacteroides sp. ET71]MCL1617582.1 DNA-binding protein [Bacteroides sp. ET71]
MKAKCNLAKKLEPVTKTPKWYATTASKGTLDADETAALAVVDTTLSKGEFNHAMEVASEKLIPAVLSGLTVTIGKLGKLRLSFGSQGVENIDDFDARTMIQNAKFIFTPSKEVKAALASATFEVEGVVEDGIKYGSTRSYKLAKGLITPDQPDTEDPDSGDDSGQGTFG